MAIKVIFAIETIILIVIAGMFATEKLVWHNDDFKTQFEQVKDSAQILKPEALIVNGDELLVVPKFSIKGKSWNFDYSIYTYDRESKQLILIMK